MRREPHGLRALGLWRGTRFILLVFQRRADERREQWVRFQWFRFEFRVELAAEEPRVVRRLDNFHVILIRRASRDAQSCGNQGLFVVAVEFVVVAVPLAVASYNAGQGNVFRWRRAAPHKPMDEFLESIPFSETRNYVKRVTMLSASYRRITR